MLFSFFSPKTPATLPIYEVWIRDCSKQQKLNGSLQRGKNVEQEDPLWKGVPGCKKTPRAADEEELNGPTRALKCESRGTEHRGTELSASGGDGR